MLAGQPVGGFNGLNSISGQTFLYDKGRNQMMTTLNMYPVGSASCPKAHGLIDPDGHHEFNHPLMAHQFSNEYSDLYFHNNGTDGGDDSLQ